MGRNVSWSVVIVILFTLLFFLGNSSYFHLNSKLIAEDGVVDIDQVDKQAIVKLDGEWAFYPNVLISPEADMREFESQRRVIAVPSNWNHLVKSNDEGLSVGTYHLKVRVPIDGQYGLYLRTIRQANRVFINGLEVGSRGNPSTTFESFRVENADKYTVFFSSEQRMLDIIIHVANYNYSKAGILYQVELGTKDAIHNHYNKKLLLDALISIGYIICGFIYFISYSLNRKRKEELYFGIFIFLFGFYMSFINQKIFFHFFPQLGVFEQIRLQLGIIPFIALSLTYFLHAMYPRFLKKRTINTISVVLGVIFFIYVITDPFTNNGTGAILFLQILYVSTIMPVVLYNLFGLVAVVVKREEGAQYILIVVVSLCCYSALMVLRFLFDLSMDYSEMLLFALVLYSFASLLSYRANAAFTKTQQLSEELYTNNQLKDEFLIKTSHRLRTPLHRIQLLSKSLMEGTLGPLKREQQEHMIAIHNDTKRMELLVDDFLFSSNHMSDEITVTPSAVSVTIVHEIVDEIRSLLPNKASVELISEVDDQLPAMYTDELRFKQILYNLLDNAVHHTTQGQIKIIAEVLDNHMVIHVMDTGSGIPAQEQDYIFHSFYRGSNKKKGLGLGLAIAKNMVEKLNGSIRVNSTAGIGSTFTFTMPLAKFLECTEVSATSSIDELELPLILQGSGRTILIVDDDLENIMLLADALHQVGYTIVAVDNGYNALQYINSHTVDCMLVDYMLSGMSGRELCGLVRKQYDLLELPIILLTSIMKHSEFMESLHSGANDYLLKPIVIEDVMVKIQSVLAVRQSSIDAIAEEMNVLYAQVTPHFVYNTLNTIIGLSYKDMKSTRNALYYLSTYFRAKLNVHYRDSMVSISEELELVKAYLSIEKMRLDDRLTVVYDIDESINIRIPALSIQPLVENAVFHGISKRKQGGRVEVSVKREGQLVQIKIDDNGVGIPKEKLKQIEAWEGTRIGLKNPLKKFKLMKNASFRLFSEEGKGTTVIILLPGDDRIEYSHH